MKIEIDTETLECKVNGVSIGVRNFDLQSEPVYGQRLQGDTLRMGRSVKLTLDAFIDQKAIDAFIDQKAIDAGGA